MPEIWPRRAQPSILPQSAPRPAEKLGAERTAQRIARPARLAARELAARLRKRKAEGEPLARLTGLKKKESPYLRLFPSRREDAVRTDCTVCAVKPGVGLLPHDSPREVSGVVWVPAIMYNASLRRPGRSKSRCGAACSRGGNSARTRAPSRGQPRNHWPPCMRPQQTRRRKSTPCTFLA